MSVYAPHLDWIAAQHERLLALVTRWANLHSGSRNLPGLAALTAALCEDFAPLGAEMREVALPDETGVDDAGQPTATPLGRALALRRRPNAARRVLLGIHMDTVYPADGPFQRAERLDGRTLRGPGVTDAKGGLAVMLIALEALERSPWPDGLGWEVIINPDEEIGSPGSAPLWMEAAQRNHLGLLFEPALDDAGTLVSERRGSGNFAFVVHGRSAHAGRDSGNGRNAIVALAELLTEVDRWSDPARGLTVNVGRVHGGGALNVVPDLAVGRFNVRITQPEQAAACEARLADLVATINQREGLRVELHGHFHAPPKPLDPATAAMLRDLAACGRDLGLNLTWQPSGGASDGNRLAAAGLPTVDSLGVRGGAIHSLGEYLLIDSLVERAQLAGLYLLKLASGALPLPIQKEVEAADERE